MEKSKLENISNESKLTSKDFCKLWQRFEVVSCLLLHISPFSVTPQAKKACFIAFTSYVLCFLCGTMAVVNYITEIFAETGSSLSIKNSSFLVSIGNLIGNLMFFAIVEQFKRRVCSIIEMLKQFPFYVYTLCL